MPTFVEKPERRIVHALRAGADTSVDLDAGKLIGIKPGFWYVMMSDGNSIVMSHEQFLDRYSPNDEWACKYLERVSDWRLP